MKTKKKTKLNPLVSDCDARELGAYLAQRLKDGLAHDAKAKAAECDPAAVYGIAASLDAYSHASGFRGNVSEAYNGADQFMREIMATGVAFETWANANVDFDRLDDVWPYMLQDKFAAALARAWGDENAVLHLVEIRTNATTFPAIAKNLGLKLKA